MASALLQLWIGLGAYLTIVGWTLSAMGALNAFGYGAALLLFGCGAAVWLGRPGQVAIRLPGRTPLLRLARRARRPFPFLFFLGALLILIGGTLYAPTQFDALTYRLPRMLNWMLAGHWHWIPTINQRMNYSGPGWEWLGLPLLVFTHSDRLMFLINFTGFCLLPGLLFSVFRSAGVPRRVAWTWMWLLPLGYGYATQAGGVGNDFTGVIFCLAAIHFGFQARKSGKAAEVWLALTAAALMTGVKLSNLPLALPCLVAVGPALRQTIKNWRHHWRAGIGVTAICVLTSALPIMALNQKFTGAWHGDPRNKYQMQITAPLAGLAVNGFLLAESSFMPPVLPGSPKLSERLTKALPVSWRQAFPRIALNRLPEIPGEEGAALGLGVTLPLLLGLAAAVAGGGRTFGWRRFFSAFPPVALAAWIALVFFMIKSGSEAGPRLLLPYYPLAVIPLLLLAPQRDWLRRRWWRGLLWFTAAGVLPVLIFSVSRPLWPAAWAARQWAEHYPESPLCRRLATTYSVYAHRNDLLAPLRDPIPAVTPTQVICIGLIAGSDDSGYSLWRPFGHRTVLDLRASTADFIAHPELAPPDWVVIKAGIWPELCPTPLAQWAAAHHFEIKFTCSLVELVSRGPETWCLLHRKADGESN